MATKEEFERFKEEVYKLLDDRLSDLEKNAIRIAPIKFTQRHVVAGIMAGATVALYVFGLSADSRNKVSEKFLSDLGAWVFGASGLILLLKKTDD